MDPRDDARGPEFTSHRPTGNRRREQGNGYEVYVNAATNLSPNIQSLLSSGKTRAETLKFEKDVSAKFSRVIEQVQRGNAMVVRDPRTHRAS